VTPINFLDDKTNNIIQNLNSVAIIGGYIPEKFQTANTKTGILVLI
jgi:hypothetical protein